MRRAGYLLVLVAILATATTARAEAVFSATAAWRGGLPRPGAQATLEVTVQVDQGWHVNSNTPLDPYLIPTSIALKLPNGWSSGPVRFPAHRLARFAFSDQPVAVFEGRFTASVDVTAGPAPWPDELRGTVEAQACNNSTCMAPEEVTFSVPLAGDAGPAVPPASAASTAPPTGPTTDAGSTPGGGPAGGDAGLQHGLASRFAESGLLLQLAIVFLAGLALNLTPCVYPLIPITVGFFMAQKAASKAGTWILAGLYVLGMSLTYSALGVAAAMTGRLFGSALQSPWVVAVIVAVMLVLAASMFGVWELRVPAWATRASGGRSGPLGAVIMGLAVGLVAAPCIGPFVLGLLTYVGQRQDPVLGFAMFFTLSLGLGLPYLLLGVFTGAIERLPNSGAWMTSVRQVFGVLLVALAAYFGAPFLPGAWGGRVMSGLLVIGGAYLLVVARPGHEQPWIDRAMRAASAALLVAGVLLYPSQPATNAEHLSWRPFEQAEVDQAAASGQLVMLDFSADWCLPCKELDEKTFSDPAVRSALAPLARFKVDMTASTPENEALRSRYKVAGVPTILFLDSHGEIAASRLTGFEEPGRFLDRLARVRAAATR